MKDARKVIDLQMKIGEVSIADIKFDLRSRDEIPKLFCGLQGIYCNRKIREQEFEIFKKIVSGDNDDPNSIGLVHHYQSLMPMAQEARKPVFFLKPAEGAIGSHAQSVSKCYVGFGIFDDFFLYPILISGGKISG